MPRLNDLENLVLMALALKNYPDWGVTVGPLPPSTPGGPMVAFGIVRYIPSGPTSSPSGPLSYPSEVLMAGQFSEFPRTRRAPVTAMEVFVGSPPARDPKTGNVPTKTNLAHIQLPGVNDTTFHTWWNRSIADRLKSLGQIADARAKAKVSFVVPLTLATRLGCLPQP